MFYFYAKISQTYVAIAIYIIVKVRLQTQKAQTKYKGTWDCFASTVRQEKVITYFLLATVKPYFLYKWDSPRKYCKSREGEQ